MMEQKVDLRGIRGTRTFHIAFLEFQYFPSLTFSQNTRICDEAVKLASRDLKGYIASNVLWHQRLRKCYKQEIFCNAELLCKEADVIFRVQYDIFV
jgi:hypothetical protein